VDKEDEREVPERIGKNFADANGFDYFLETSALDATNVDTLFQEVATRLTNDMKLTDERYFNINFRHYYFFHVYFHVYFFHAFYLNFFSKIAF
jgi:hypothetical protein